jgi:hypothetical protein
MERSEAVTVILARIMKMMDRSSESMLTSFSHFEGSDRIVEASANPLRRQPYGRERNAHPNRDLLLRKPRYLDSDNFAHMAHGDTLNSQHKSYELEH